MCLYWASLIAQFGEGNGTQLQYFCLGNPMDGGAWWAAVHGVAKSWTRLSDLTFTFHFHALEKAMATHSSVLAWRIPGTVELGGLPSMGSHRVGHDWSDLVVVIVDSSVGKESPCNAGGPSLIPGSGRCPGEGISYHDPWIGKIPWRRERLHTSVFWPEEFHGLYSPWGPKIV